MDMSSRIILDIDRIVLHGFDSIDRQALLAALQQSLSEWLNGNPSFTNADRAHIQARIELPGNSGTEQASRALGKGLSGIIAGNSATTGPERRSPPGVGRGA
jgi:hypothetical protein